MLPLSTKADDLAASLRRTKEEVDRLSGLLAGWTQSGNTYLDMPFFRAERGEYVHPPFLVAELSLATTQAITSGAWNTVVYDTITQNPGVVDYSTASTGAIRFYAVPNRKAFLLFGRMVWASTAGTFRSVKVEGYPSTEEILMVQNDGDEIVQAFASFYAPADDTTSLSIRVFENTTAGLTSATLAIWDLGVVR